jgi:hypothetical protein
MSDLELELAPTNRAFVAPNRLVCWLIALPYASLLAAIPLTLSDRANYLAEIGSGSLVILAKNIVAGPLATLSNAPLWLLVTGALGLVLQPEQALRLIIFVQAAVVAYLLLRADRKNWPWMIVLLLMPLFLENYDIELRQGAGITVFLMGWFSTGRIKRWLLIGASPFIHESYAFVVALYLMTELMRRLRLADDVKLTVVMLFSVLVSLSLLALATLVGARQATEYNLAASAVSGAAFLIWLAILGLFLLGRYELRRYYEFSVSAITFYLGAYYLASPAGRIFESMLPVVYLCGLQLTSWRRVIFLWLIVSVGIIGWALALSEPAKRLF